MSTNDFKPFAVSSDANVTAQNDWLLLPALAQGFQSGKASSAQINKALRQSSTMAATIGQFIANAGTDALDNGDITTMVANLIAALKANLSLKSAAFKDIGNGAGQIPDMSFFTSNTAPTGWKKTPDNFYTEWGYASNNNNGPVTISFPATLPNAVRAINITPVVTSPTGWDCPTIAAYDRTGMVINRKAGGSSGNIQDTNWSFFWCIQGY